MINSATAGTAFLDLSFDGVIGYGGTFGLILLVNGGNNAVNDRIQYNLSNPNLPSEVLTLSQGSTYQNGYLRVPILFGPGSNTLNVALTSSANLNAAFDHTLGLDLVLPSSASFTSTSGVFLTQAHDAISGGVTFANTVVPEPATWVMMISGFGLIGGTLRRRRTSSPICFVPQL